ncbi:MAG: FAD-binding oxidoreductase [Planctomycetaceae bacterium]
MPDPQFNASSPVSSMIVDYPARDMTITVGAGMSYGTLRTVLRKENQQLPIDVANEDTPLGDLVAYDICGPRQFGYGSLRDYVIGIEAVDGIGRVFHAGGRVVKNVAGYDLCRLLVGSRNQLGTITQLTFKLKPLPAQQSLIAAGFRSLRDLESALERLNLTATTPVILDVLGRSATSRLLADSMPELTETIHGQDAAAVLVLGFEGPPVACQWQTKTLQDELAGTAVWCHFATRADAFPIYCRTAQRAATDNNMDPWLARLITLPSRVVSSLSVLQEAGCEVFGRAGNGILYVRPSTQISSPQPPDEAQAATILSSLVTDGNGSFEMLRSTNARSTVSAAPVREFSKQLIELLGGQ